MILLLNLSLTFRDELEDGNASVRINTGVRCVCAFQYYQQWPLYIGQKFGELKSSNCTAKCSQKYKPGLGWVMGFWYL